MDAQKNKRQRIVVDKKYQWRYVTIIVFMILLNLVVGWTVYYTIWTTILHFHKIDFRSTFNLVNTMLALRGLFLAVLTICLGLFISHKTAGPLFRIKKLLRKVGEKDISQKVTLKRWDELKDLAAVVNEMLEKQNSYVKKEKSLIEDLNRKIKEGKIEEVKFLAGELQTLIRGYRLRNNAHG
jgi:methyl-accepting chemotaxis protein